MTNRDEDGQEKQTGGARGEKKAGNIKLTYDAPQTL